MKIYNVLICSFVVSASALVYAEPENGLLGSAQANEACIRNPQSEVLEKPTYFPKEGYVPNEDAAIKIAVAVWEPIYGSKKIKNEKPYKAKLESGVWFVSGSLRSGFKGGVAEIEICKTTAQVIRLSHGK
ncbi:MAG TPA: NTF2 fold immunity protein [Cellvibrionaceae bacterium]|nr:NTF2 fold immunity protein [Cellvibrionaceae bacterium]